MDCIMVVIHISKSEFYLVSLSVFHKSRIYEKKTYAMMNIEIKKYNPCFRYSSIPGE